MRELELITGGEQSGTIGRTTPRRLLELAYELEKVYRPYAAGSGEELDAAWDRGEESVPVVTYGLPPDGLDTVERSARLLAETEHFCRSEDELLTLAPTPDLVAYRQWSLDEARHQFAGRPPTPWPAYAAARGLLPSTT